MNRHLNIKYLPIDSVKPNARNARTHSPEQIQQVAYSIRTLGFINPVVVDEKKKLLAGHARVLAADLLELDFIPTICVDHLTEAEKRAYMLADNKLTENAVSRLGDLWILDHQQVIVGDNSFGQGREESLTWHATVKPVPMLMDAPRALRTCAPTFRRSWPRRSPSPRVGND